MRKKWDNRIFKASDFVRKAKKYVEKGAAIAEAADEIRKATTPFGILQHGLNGLTQILDVTIPLPHNRDGFNLLHLGGMKSTFLDRKELIEEVLRDSLYLYQMFDYKVYIDSDKDIYARCDDIGKVFTSMCQSWAKEVWEEHGRSVTLRRRQDRIWCFEPEKSGGLASDQSEAVYERTKKFLDAGYHRTIFLLGPPGTGKSEMARRIGELFGKYVLHIEVSQIQNMRMTDASYLTKILSPSVLIIDDFDQVSDSGVLDFLEKIRERVDLFIGTLNCRDDLDSAALRAGRVDEIVDVISVREVEDIIPGLTPEQYDRVRKWPIAFLEELRIRLDVLGLDSFDTEIVELAKREGMNENYVRRRGVHEDRCMDDEAEC